MNFWTGIIILLLIACCFAPIIEGELRSGVVRRVRQRPRHYVALLAVALAWTLAGADKGYMVYPQLRMLMFDPIMRTIFGSHDVPKADDVQVTFAKVDQAQASMQASAAARAQVAQAATVIAVARTNAACVTLDADWHYSQRDPQPANILASVVWVNRTNINAVAYDDLFVEYSLPPSSSPAMLFEYAMRLGTIERVRPVTNSYPDTVTLTLASGAHECLWFRCQVPASMVRNVRTWETEARLGGPVGSETGFDISGLLLIDNGAGLWQGRTLSTQIGGEACEFVNGILLAPMLKAAAAAPEFE